MPMHTTGEETWLSPGSRMGFGPEPAPYPHPPSVPPRPYLPPEFSPVTSQPYHPPPANLGYSFTIDDGPHNGPHIRTMLPLPSEFSDEPPTEYNHTNFMINDYPSYFYAPKPSESLLNATSSFKRKRAMPADWSPVKKAKPIDENQGDEAILNVLLNKPRSDGGHRLNIRINNLVKQVAEVLSKSNISDQLRNLSVEEAQCTLDFLQDLLDVTGIPVISKHTLLKTSLRLTRTHDCVPRCLMLRGFRKTGDHAFALGHFGEVWRGEVEGVEVAVKQARIFTSDNNIKKVLRVGCYQISATTQISVTFPL
ncbi:hypothetical protein ARMSODRAFT_922583 [Armillaria solidipes]|uniref:Uncharacterized protein n=1 Tax=Armillaria solidipes TaxID=1076256 RepID=A0A2H3AT82_9AGAR|nr:hypothetical protein ARMSODRAFT_922583 [Armillaria solidipes]